MCPKQGIGAASPGAAGHRSPVGGDRKPKARIIASGQENQTLPKQISGSTSVCCGLYGLVACCVYAGGETQASLLENRGPGGDRVAAAFTGPEGDVCWDGPLEGAKAVWGWGRSTSHGKAYS